MPSRSQPPENDFRLSPGAAKAQRAGEHDRDRGRRIGGLAGDLTQHLDAADLSVFQVRRQLARERRGAVGETRRGGVDFQQNGRGVVAQQQPHVGMQIRAVERGDRDAETLRPAPGGKNVGIGGGQQHRKRQAMRPRLTPERVRGSRLQHHAASAEVPAGRAHRIAHHRQVRSARQGQGAGLPVPFAASPRLGVAGGDLRQHHVPEADGDRRQNGRRVVVQQTPFVTQRVDAGGIEGDQVEAHMQSCGVAETGDPNIEQRPGVRLRHAPSQSPSQPLQLGGRVLVAHMEAIVRNIGQDLLRAVGADDHAQHVVAPDQLVPCRFGTGEIHLAGVELGVKVATDAAQREIVAPAEEIRLLHIGQREGHVAIGDIGHDGTAAARFRCDRSGGRRRGSKQRTDGCALDQFAN